MEVVMKKLGKAVLGLLFFAINLGIALGWYFTVEQLAHVLEQELTVSFILAFPLIYGPMLLYLLSFIISFIHKRRIKPRGLPYSYYFWHSLNQLFIRGALLQTGVGVTRAGGEAPHPESVILFPLIAILSSGLLWFYYGKLMRGISVRSFLKEMDTAVSSRSGKNGAEAKLSGFGTRPNALAGFHREERYLWNDTFRFTLWMKEERVNTKTNMSDTSDLYRFNTYTYRSRQWRFSLEISADITGLSQGEFSPDAFSSQLSQAGKSISNVKQFIPGGSLQCIEVTKSGICLVWRPPYAPSYMGIKFPKPEHLMAKGEELKAALV